MQYARLAGAQSVGGSGGAPGGDGRHRARLFGPQHGVLTLGSTLGSLAAQGSTYLVQQLLHGGSELDLLRAEMRAGFARLGVPTAPASPAGPSGGGGARPATPAPAVLTPAQVAALEQALAAPLEGPEQLAAQFAAFDRLLQQPWPPTPEP